MSDFKSFKSYCEAMSARDWQQCDLIATENQVLVKKIEELEETHLLQLAGISTIAGCNTEESFNNCSIDKENPYWTVAFDDVSRTVKRERVLIEKIEELEKTLREIRLEIRRPFGLSNYPYTRAKENIEELIFKSLEEKEGKL